MSELPIELRGLSASLVDRVEPNALATVGPSVFNGTPGLAGAAVTGAPFVPGPSIEDPQALQLGIARVAGEHFGAPTSIVPTTVSPSTSPQTFGNAPTFAPSVPDSPLGFDLDAIALAMVGESGDGGRQSANPANAEPGYPNASAGYPSPVGYPATGAGYPNATSSPPRNGASSSFANAPISEPPASAPPAPRNGASSSFANAPTSQATGPMAPRNGASSAPRNGANAPTAPIAPRNGASSAPRNGANAHPQANALDRGFAHATPGIAPEIAAPEIPAGGFSPTIVPMADVPMLDAGIGALPQGSAPPIGGGTGALFSPPNSPGIEYVPLVGDSSVSPQISQSDRVPLIENRAGVFDPHVVRRDFPILDQRVNGRRLVWLDNGATTQKPRAVIDRLSKFYERENSNVHRGAHTLAARATDAYESARETTRKFLNAASTSEIVFVRGATEGINLVAKSWGQRYLERGDEIVITHLEHHANIVPWQQLCQMTGARLRVAPVDDRGDIILEEYERLMCARTKLVSFTHVSNALGTITPAREMAEIAHRWGATVIIDGAQGVSHMPVDVQALDADFYIFSGHKVFAPTGIGAVYGKRAVLDATPPWQGGGNMIADVTFEKTVYQPPPWRFEAGTGNIADAAGMGAALDYVMRLGMPNIARYEHDLLVYGLERLATVRGLHMIGNPRDRAGVMSFVLDGQRTEDVGGKLDKYGIAVRSGHHCAQPILRRFGVEASVRASLAFYNVPEDIDALVEALHQIQSA